MSFFRFLTILSAIVLATNYVTTLELEGIDCKKLQKKLGFKSINEVYLPHEEDCSAFYHCGLGGAVKQPCGDGTIFSLRNKDCRRPEDTKCITLERYLEKKNVALVDFYDEDY